MRSNLLRIIPHDPGACTTQSRASGGIGSTGWEKGTKDRQPSNGQDARFLAAMSGDGNPVREHVHD